MDYNITYREKDKGIQYIISYKNKYGEWKQKSKQGFKGKKEAKAAANIHLDQLKKEFKLNLDESYENITFRTFSKIYKEHKKLHREYNTIKTLNNSLNKFKSLLDIKIKKITPLDIQKCVDGLVKQEFAHSSITLYCSMIKTLFTSAVEQFKIIGESPFKNITLGKSKEVKQRKTLSDSKFKMLIEKTNTLKLKTILLVAGTCGPRAGELIGITWDCIDVKRSMLKINKQWKKSKEGVFGFGELKTKNSYREVPIPPITMKYLLLYRDKYPTDINNRVFLYSDQRSLYNSVKYVLKKNDLGDYTLHEFRHTYTTKLIANGIDIKTVAKLIGDDVKQVLNTYSHVTEEMLIKAENTISQIF